jgi:hypothetical protein
MQISYSKIISSRRVPEANIQAEFYLLCRQHGIPVLLEVTHEDCRFDALIFKDDKPFAIVEIKNYGSRCSVRGLKKDGRQWKKYSKYGVQVIQVLNSRQIVPRFNQMMIDYHRNTSE